MTIFGMQAGIAAVSYTHLDVYKRQDPDEIGRPVTRVTEHPVGPPTAAQHPFELRVPGVFDERRRVGARHGTRLWHPHGSVCAAKALPPLPLSQFWCGGLCALAHNPPHQNLC